MLGPAAGGRALRGQPRGWSRRATYLIGGVGVLFAAGAVVFATTAVDEGTAVAYVMTVGLTAAMGLQAAVAR